MSSYLGWIRMSWYLWLKLVKNKRMDVCLIKFIDFIICLLTLNKIDKKKNHIKQVNVRVIIRVIKIFFFFGEWTDASSLDRWDIQWWKRKIMCDFNECREKKKGKENLWNKEEKKENDNWHFLFLIILKSPKGNLAWIL